MSQRADTTLPTDPHADSREPKLAALARHATLHPHPEQVSDPLFAASAFFDPRDAVQVKYEMLRRVRVDGMTVTEAVRAFAMSRPTFYDAQRELAAEGMAGLLPLKKGPRRAHKMTGEVMAFIASAVLAEPGLTPAAIARRLTEQLGVHVHARTVARAMERPSKKA